MSANGGKYFAPKPGRFGKHVAMLVAPVGTAANTTLTSSGTTTFSVAAPYRKQRFEKAAYANVSLPGLSAAGAAVATVFRIASGGTATALTASLTLDAASANAVVSFTNLAWAISDPILAEGDRFEVRVSLGTASVTTGSTGGYWFTVESIIAE